MHRYKLRRNESWPKVLQRAWNEYGEQAFQFLILEPVPDRAQLLIREQAWADKYPPNMLYNRRILVHTHAGIKHDPEARAKMSKTRMGVPQSVAHSAAISVARKGQLPERVRRMQVARDNKLNDIGSQIIAMYKSGLRQKDIAVRLDVCQTTVGRWLWRLGVTKSKRGGDSTVTSRIQRFRS